jgi:IrrE N-terminal-like domain
MHRSLFPKGLECNEEAVTFRNGDELEAEADTFAAYLLMPLDDFRRQIPADADPTLDDLSAAAERYGVSLIACVLRWLEYTTRRSMLVISRDGFILWARASEPAFMSGLFIRSKNVAPVEVPSASLLGRADLADVGREGVDHPPGVWFSEDSRNHDSLGQVRPITRNPAFRPRHAHVQEFRRGRRARCVRPVQPKAA